MFFRFSEGTMQEIIVLKINCFEPLRKNNIKVLNRGLYPVEEISEVEKIMWKPEIETVFNKTNHFEVISTLLATIQTIQTVRDFSKAKYA